MTRSRRSAPRTPGPSTVEVCADFEPRRLIQARNLLGWRRRDLADATGITPQQIQWWEVGVSVPKPYELEQVAEATGCLVAFFKRGRPLPQLDSGHLFMCTIDR